VIDEFNGFTTQTPHQHDKLALAISLLHGSNYWGLTGTPKVSESLDIFTMAKLLHVDIESRGTIAVFKEFIGKFMTKNEPDLTLPEKTESVVWVTLPEEERFDGNDIEGFRESKVRALLRYIKTTLIARPESKFVLFVQVRR
jgi:hypothetical protein